MALATPEMDVFVTLVNGWKLLTYVTREFIVDVAMGFFKCVSVKQLLKIIKNRLKLIYFFSY